MGVEINVSGSVLRSFRAPPSLSLAQRAQLTQALSTVNPVLETCDADEQKVIRKIESLIGQPIDIISRGPSAEDVKRLNSFTK
jgi:hypothetical protein